MYVMKSSYPLFPGIYQNISWDENTDSSPGKEMLVEITGKLLGNSDISQKLCTYFPQNVTFTHKNNEKIMGPLLIFNNIFYEFVMSSLAIIENIKAPTRNS